MGVLLAINTTMRPPSGVPILAAGPLWLAVFAMHTQHEPGGRCPPSKRNWGGEAARLPLPEYSIEGETGSASD